MTEKEERAFLYGFNYGRNTKKKDTDALEEYKKNLELQKEKK